METLGREMNPLRSFDSAKKESAAGESVFEMQAPMSSLPFGAKPRNVGKTRPLDEMRFVTTDISGTKNH